MCACDGQLICDVGFTFGPSVLFNVVALGWRIRCNRCKYMIGWLDVNFLCHVRPWFQERLVGSS